MSISACEDLMDEDLSVTETSFSMSDSGNSDSERRQGDASKACFRTGG